MRFTLALQRVLEGDTIQRKDDEAIIIEPSDLEQDNITFEKADFENEWRVIKKKLLTMEELEYLSYIVRWAPYEIKSITKSYSGYDNSCRLIITYEEEIENTTQAILGFLFSG